MSLLRVSSCCPFSLPSLYISISLSLPLVQTRVSLSSVYIGFSYRFSAGPPPRGHTSAYADFFSRVDSCRKGQLAPRSSPSRTRSLPFTRLERVYSSPLPVRGSRERGQICMRDYVTYISKEQRGRQRERRRGGRSSRRRRTRRWRKERVREKE